MRSKYPGRVPKAPVAEFGNRLLMLTEGFTHSEFENKVGLPRGAVGKYMKGVNPSLDVLERIIRIRGCNGHWLVTGEGPPEIVPFKKVGRPRRDMTPHTALAKRLQYVFKNDDYWEIAKCFGVSQTTAACYLTGATTPTADSLAKVAEIRNIPAGWLLTGFGQEPDVPEPHTGPKAHVRCVNTNMTVEEFSKLVEETLQDLLDKGYRLLKPIRIGSRGSALLCIGIEKGSPDLAPILES